MDTPRIGFVGTGLMGLPMARNLLRAGYAVAAHNRTRAKATTLLDEGAVWAETPAAAARGADYVITMVSDTPDVRDVLLGADGVATALSSGAVVIDMSTISPSATRAMAADLESAGAEMLDAPVSGGVKGAIEGTLSIMVGGKRDVFEAARPVLGAMGKNLVYCGGHGLGQMTKLCNQIAIAAHMLAASEAIVFARKAGLDPATMIEAIGAGAAGSWVINVLGPKMVNHDFAPGFMVKLLQKDLRLVQEAASEMGAPLPAASLAHQLYNAAEAAGLGDEGTQALVAVYETMARLASGAPGSPQDAW